MWPREIVIRDVEFKVVSRSKNLRGILEYSRRHKTERIDLYKDKHGGGAGQFGIAWENGSTTICDFADYSIMEEFSRKRTFKGAMVKIHEPNKEVR